MEQPLEGQEQRSGDAKPDQDAASQSVAAIKQKHDHDRKAKQEDIGRRIKQGCLCFGRYFKKLFRTGPDRHIELLLTIAIAWFAYAQWSTARDNNKSTGRQTQDLIRAAQLNANSAAEIAEASAQNAKAAEAFARSASYIDAGVGSAVQKLQGQVNQTEAASKSAFTESEKSLQAARDSVYLEQRPWVGIQFYIGTPSRNLIQTGSGSPSSAQFVAYNSGRTPAVKFRVECCEDFEQPEEFPIPDYDTLHADVLRDLNPDIREAMRIDPKRDAWQKNMAIQDRARADARAKEQNLVIIPNGTVPVSNLLESGPPDSKFHYALGRFVYRDTIDPTIEHITKFCLYRFSNQALTLCTGGQDMQ